jgi:hypothetical protein
MFNILNIVDKCLVRIILSRRDISFLITMYQQITVNDLFKVS